MSVLRVGAVGTKERSIEMAGTRGDDAGIIEEERSNREGKTRRIPSLVSLAMARTASNPPGVSSMDPKELTEGLKEGVLIDDDGKKFWIDEKLHKNCFMVLAKSLTITWGKSKEYWSWTPNKEDCFRGPFDIIEARLKQVSWLEITGKFPSTMLSLTVTYEVVFKLMITDDADGWSAPVNLALILPSGATQNRTEDFGKMPRGEWLEIPLGEFVATPDIVGGIRFSLSQYSGEWKRGLVIRGVIFRPKY